MPIISYIFSALTRTVFSLIQFTRWVVNPRKEVPRKSPMEPPMPFRMVFQS